MVWLLPFLVILIIRGRKLKRLKQEAKATNSLVSVDQIPAPLLGISWKRALIAAALFSFIATASGYTWYKSLTETIISLNNAIYQSGPLFVFIFSVFLLGEKVTMQKCLAVVVCTTGVILITFSKGNDHSSNHKEETAMGYILVVISTALYAIFEVWFLLLACQYPSEQLCVQVLYAKYVDFEAEEEEDDAPTVHPEADSGDESPAERSMNLNPAGPVADEAGLAAPTAVSPDDPQLDLWYYPEKNPAFVTQVTMSFAMLGLMGLATAILQWPMILILNSTGEEVFVAPSFACGPGEPCIFEKLLSNCGLDALYNVLLVFGISITSPVFISVGTMLVAPITVIVDRLKVPPQEFDWKGWVGIVCVVVAFAVLKLPARYTGFHKCNRLEPCRGKKAQYHPLKTESK